MQAKYRRYFSQVIPFSLMWLVFGLVYVFLEVGILGRLTYYPATGNKYDFQNALIYTGIGSFLIGTLQGFIEVVWLRKHFDKRALWAKFFFKSVFYLFFLIFFLVTLTMVTNMNRFNTGIFDPVVLDSLKQFITKFSFWSIVIYSAAILNLALFFSEIREYLGVGVLRNFFLGKYHTPKQETRIFMFLDMKSSTTIAENMGHERYFHLIKAYYANMTNAILETSGDIYQYVGDEIVVSWTEQIGLYNNNCIECFHKIDREFKKRKEHYLETFGLVPDFKAGFHIREVTTGEIGIIKKDIIYTGDVLNTTARIQRECNNYDTRALISEDLVKKLSPKDNFNHTKIGKLLLRGKKEAIQLHSIEF